MKKFANHPLYQAAEAADTAYRAAVVKQYGAINARDAAYYPSTHNKATMAARAAKIAADEAWLTYLCAPRSVVQS